MIASGHPLASQAAIRVLQHGGNAIDAAVTAAWVLAVVKPDASGLGGDVFMLHYDASTGGLDVLNGSGRSPAGASLDEFGLGIPTTGPRSSTVPGAVRGWADALARWGTMDLADTIVPAVRYAEEGFPVSVRLSTLMDVKRAALSRFPAAADAYLRDGRSHKPGSMLRLPDLAKSLRAIATDGADVFYKGRVGEAIVASQQQAGGLIEMQDLAEHSSTIMAPLKVRYRDYEVCVQPPVSLGIALLQQLKIFEGEEPARLDWDSAERLHMLIEAKKLSFADVDRYISDPDRTNVPALRLISSEYAATRRALTNHMQASSGFPAGLADGMGDNTTYMAVVDGRGNAVSWIQTLFGFFGSCWMAPGTGIVLNNRLKGFSDDPTHVNRLEGGKRTAHTLLAPMLLRGGRPVLVFGTPGDYGQTQTNLQLVTNYVDYEMDVQAMIDCPRWRSHEGCELSIESRYSDMTIAGLRQRGHRLDVLGPWSDAMGGAQAIHVDWANGCIQGAADSRREGYAVGW